MTPTCRRTPSSGLPWSGTWSGALGWPCTTPSPAPMSCSRPPCRTGAGASPRPIGPEPPPQVRATLRQPRATPTRAAGGRQRDGEQGEAREQLQVARQELRPVPVVLGVGRVVAVGPGGGRRVADQPALEQAGLRGPEVRPGGEDRPGRGGERVPGAAGPAAAGA